MLLTGTGPGGSGVTLLCRVVGNDGLPITRATVSSIGWTLTDLTAGSIVATGVWPVATTVFDALQQADPRWQLDSVTRPGRDGLAGYNLLGTVPAADFALGTPTAVPPGWPPPAPHAYQVDVLVTPASGEPFRVTGQFRPEAVVYG